MVERVITSIIKAGVNTNRFFQVCFFSIRKVISKKAGKVKPKTAPRVMKSADSSAVGAFLCKKAIR
ncbi:MAG: hypothetical protein QW315_04300, partial [Candidatus Hadarchaeum sp.]